MLKETFITLIGKYSADKAYNDKCWSEIKALHSHSKRHYHNLTHLTHLVSELSDIKSEINEWDTVLFSVFYHDIIYSITATNNEVKSADFLSKTLQKTKFNNIEKCVDQILATESHLESDDTDTNYFIDADLAILGQPEADYILYTEKIREEYRFYPDDIFNKGRINALKHFIKLPQIFKTDHFNNKYENQAKINLEKELDTINR